MPHVFPADFPFFEVAAPSRCVLPDLSDIEFIADKSANLLSSEINQLHSQISSFPELGNVKRLASSVSGCWVPLGAAGTFIQNPRKDHWDVYSYLLNTLGKTQIPNSLCLPNNSGAQAELNAWDAASILFTASQSPTWSFPDKRPGPVPLFNVDAIFSSVWIDRPISQIPYVVDQLWVLSWVNDPDRRVIVAVEIDGGHKWNVESDGGKMDSKARSICRSNDILKDGVALFRLGSAHCSSQADADSQIKDLWGRLSTAAFLRRMNVVSFLAQDAKFTDSMLELMLTKYKESGFEW